MLYVQIDTITYSGTAQRQVFNEDLDSARTVAKDMTRTHSPYEFITVSIQQRDDHNTTAEAIHKFNHKEGWTSEHYSYTAQDHTCVIRETPDGMGCAICMYS